MRFAVAWCVLIPCALNAQPPDSASAPLLRPGKRLTGEWHSGQRADSAGYRSNRYIFAGKRDEHVSIALNAAFGGRLAILVDVNGKPVEIARSDSVKPVTTIDLKLPVDGRYTIVARARSAGAYTISARSLGSVSGVDWSVVYPGGGEPGDKYALLVGVNDYPGTRHDLSGGPLVDVELMRHVLVEKLGFAPKNILILRDEEGNREQVVEAFRRHLGQAGPGGSAFFFYSGHGIQLSARPAGGTDREADGRDEALSLWGTQDELYGYLLDDELGVLIDELRTDRVMVVLDDCNSGTATRGGTGVSWSELSGGVPLPEITGWHARRSGIPPVQLKSIRASDITRQLENPALRLSPRPGARKRDHVLLAASDDSEQTVSVEMQLDDGTSVQVGVFTILLFQTIMAGGPDVTFSRLVEVVRPKVMATALKVSGQPQTVQATGARLGMTIKGFLAGAR